jgi:hypothetical protein
VKKASDTELPTWVKSVGLSAGGAIANVLAVVQVIRKLPVEADVRLAGATSGRRW